MFSQGNSPTGWQFNKLHRANVQSFDYVIIGGGIVGLSVAFELLERRPDSRVAVLEKKTPGRNTRAAATAG